jgi:hypothetical protein
MLVVKKQHLVSIVATLLVFTNNLYAQWPTNSRNDPFKVFTSWDPQYFLYEREKQLMFGNADEKGTPERVMVSLSPFGQNATYAKTLSGAYCKPQDWVNSTCPGECINLQLGCTQPPAPRCPPCINSVNLGDIDGRWNLLGLIAGGIPQGVEVSSLPLLMQAYSTIFPGVEPGTVTSRMIQIPNEDPTCQPLFGYVSVPLKYRKKGIRWDVEAQICGDFGLQFEGGVVEISQVLNPCFINLATAQNLTQTITCSNTTITTEQLNCTLFDPLVPLAKQLGFDICNFTKWGIEDLYLALFWRHAHVVNFNRDLSWPRLLLIPFLRIGGSIATGHIKEPSVIFSLPFGNNGSNAFNMSAGINFDFAETVEIGGEVGFSHFFKKDFEDFRAPTNVLQSGIFPFSTPASVKPGDTAFVAGKLAAYHFIDRLSFVFQWVYVHHRKDHITLIDPDPVFLAIDDNNPLAKCNNTAWRAQLGNFALNYDISPNLGIGVLWQQMFHVRNVYNSTTVMFTVNFIF